MLLKLSLGRIDSAIKKEIYSMISCVFCYTLGPIYFFKDNTEDEQQQHTKW